MTERKKESRKSLKCRHGGKMVKIGKGISGGPVAKCPSYGEVHLKDRRCDCPGEDYGSGL